MIEEKIETFLTQIKSLDALSSSLIDELRMLKLKTELLENENNALKEELRTAKHESSVLQAELESVPTETTERKPVKKSKKPVLDEAPTLF